MCPCSHLPSLLHIVMWDGPRGARGFHASGLRLSPESWPCLTSEVAPADLPGGRNHSIPHSPVVGLSHSSAPHPAPRCGPCTLHPSPCTPPALTHPAPYTPLCPAPCMQLCHAPCTQLHPAPCMQLHPLHCFVRPAPRIPPAPRMPRTLRAPCALRPLRSPRRAPCALAPCTHPAPSPASRRRSLHPGSLRGRTEPC